MEFYQMPMFNKVLVKDIEKAEKWYEKTLGFKSVFKFRNDKNEVLMNHLRLEKYQDLMLISQTDFEVGNSIYLNILVKDIEEKSQNISQKFIVTQLEEQPWNAKEMTIKDPDGHLITLTQSNISDTDFEKLMKQTSKDY
ncbi:TPA: VOC family protein [Staphylococcus aureus]|uniref:VOC family protein n=1 Tax=Staphylococcus aureus TaxID=1280 RepID=UPI00136188B1|nr:VOC family protein [Staphylococcus aureus]MZG65527.1 VOC family protein [Staphylococcus aureus]MZG70971.1 VOC family protein [Staphylococcus aureus]MZG75044.1 VOC family protein [Staphylococcus aureus]MZI55080.1 VOC family protein [Staphylococcus aureus]